MTSLARRSTRTELMDLPETPPAEHARALADLTRVNRLTLTHRPVLRWLEAATRALPPGAAVSVLDVACGQGDLLRAIHRWGAGRGLSLTLAGLDLSTRAIAEARAATPAALAVVWQVGDVFAHTPTPPADFIVTSQFAHHLDDGQVVALLRWLDRHAGRGWYVADLHRHAVPYYGFRLLCRLMGWHRIVRIDGTISIARSFRPPEWRALLAKAGVAAKPRRHALFRLCVSRLK